MTSHLRHWQNGGWDTSGLVRVIDVRCERHGSMKDDLVRDGDWDGRASVEAIRKSRCPACWWTDRREEPLYWATEPV